MSGLFGERRSVNIFFYFCRRSCCPTENTDGRKILAMHTLLKYILFTLLLCREAAVFGQEVEKYPVHFDGDTVRLAQSPSVLQISETYYPLWGYTVSDFYSVTDSLSYGHTHVAILTPATLTPECECQSDVANRLLLIEYQGKRWVYDNVIKNDNSSGISTGCEWLQLREGGFELGYEAGQGWKIYYWIAVAICDDEPQITDIFFQEHNSRGTFMRETACSYDPENPFPLAEYDRSVPERVRQGDGPRIF